MPAGYFHAGLSGNVLPCEPAPHGVFQKRFQACHDFLAECLRTGVQELIAEGLDGWNCQSGQLLLAEQRPDVIADVALVLNNGRKFEAFAFAARKP